MTFQPRKRILLPAAVRPRTAQVILTLIPRHVLEQKLRNAPSDVVDALLEDWQLLAASAGQLRSGPSVADVGTEPLGEYLTAQQAAARLGFSDSRQVRKLFNAGRLEGRKDGKRVLVAAESVEKYDLTRRKSQGGTGRKAA
ncbi:helix-turn-helix domain-containing protein [Zhihengliuella halotolerans]|uniref:helix-turn-helix domain-containing protein n=1 Tax=Zhihengliuella halotolerans TaxID=370736 RepID=UPI000C80791F|nr:helix-turn-helix domain-containing protein [Zhihengliuella halotolerans]